MFAPPPVFEQPLLADHVTPSPKRRRVDELGENDDPNAPTSSVSKEPPSSGVPASASSLSSEQLSKIEQNRLAALARKQQRESAVQKDSSDGTCTDLEAEKRTRIEQNRQAALARKLQKAAEAQAGGQEAVKTEVEPSPVATADAAAPAGDEESSSSPSTPSFGSMSLPSTPVESDSDSSSSSSQSSSCSSSSDAGSASSDDSSSSSSDSDSDSEQKPTLSAAQLAKIAENRRIAMLRKKGLSCEQIETIEANRRAALARKRGIGAEQFARMEENRRKALARKQDKEAAARAEAAAAEKAAKAEAEDDDGWHMPPGVPAPKPAEDRDARQKLVAQILCRWWWALPAWPPENYDFDGELARRKFRRTTIALFDQEPEYDDQGFRKAYELEQFKGCFRTSDGELMDLRPVEGRPSYDQLILKSTPDLYRLLIKAFDGNLKELYGETQKEGAPQELEVHLQELKKQAAQVGQKAMFYLQFAPKVGSTKK